MIFYAESGGWLYLLIGLGGFAFLLSNGVFSANGKVISAIIPWFEATKKVGKASLRNIID